MTSKTWIQMQDLFDRLHTRIWGPASQVTVEGLDLEGEGRRADLVRRSREQDYRLHGLTGGE